MIILRPKKATYLNEDVTPHGSSRLSGKTLTITLTGDLKEALDSFRYDSRRYDLNGAESDPKFIAQLITEEVRGLMQDLLRNNDHCLSRLVADKQDYWKPGA